MYTQHFGLTQSPFDTHADSAYAFVGPRQAKMISGISSALALPDSVIAIGGPVGVGKTMLVDCALEGVKGDHVLIRIGRIRLEPDDVLDLLSEKLELGDDNVRGPMQRVAAVRQQLKDWAEKDKRVFIIVEDAQRLGIPALLELESLTAGEGPTSPGASIVLMGHSEMHHWLAVPDLMRVSQRTRLRQTVEPFNAQEVQSFLMHCLRNAGGEFGKIIRNGTVEVLHSFSGGIARVIKNLCESTFQTAADADLKTIAPQLVAKIATDVYGLKPDAGNMPVLPPLLRVAPLPMQAGGAPRPEAPQPEKPAAAAPEKPVLVEVTADAPAAIADPEPAAPAAEEEPEATDSELPEATAAQDDPPADDVEENAQAELEPTAEEESEPTETEVPEAAAAEDDQLADDAEENAQAELEPPAPTAEEEPEPTETELQAVGAEPEISPEELFDAGAESESDSHKPEVAAEETPPQAVEAAAEEEAEPQAEAATMDADLQDNELVEDPTNPHLKAIVDELPSEEDVTAFASEAAVATVADSPAETKDVVSEDKAQQPAAAEDENAAIPDLDALEAAIAAANRDLAIPVATTKPEDSNVPTLLNNFAEQSAPEEQPEDQGEPAVLEALDDKTAETLFGDDALNDIGAGIAADREAANMDQVKLSLDLTAATQRTGPLPEQGDDAYSAMTPEAGDIESTLPRKIFGQAKIPESHVHGKDGETEEKPPSLLSRYSKS